MNFQFAIYVIYADVVVSQFSFVCTTNDIHCLVQFLSDNFGFVRTLCIIASIFHAVIQCSHFVCSFAVIFVYDTSDTIFTVHTWLTVFCFHSKTVFTVLTIETNGAVFTINHNRRTIFTVYADFTVNTWFTIFTIMTDFNIVRQCIVVSMIASYSINDLFNS